MFRIKDTHAQENNIFDEDNFSSDTWLMLRCINQADSSGDTDFEQFVVHSTDDTWLVCFL